MSKPSEIWFASKAKPIEIRFHWPKLIENLQFSAEEFYTRVLAAVEKRKIPDVKIRYVRWHEGNVMSPHRMYLRLTRERMSFDICGAEFGTGFGTRVPASTCSTPVVCDRSLGRYRGSAR
jgi:hypothetical protein